MSANLTECPTCYAQVDRYRLSAHQRTHPGCWTVPVTALLIWVCVLGAVYGARATHERIECLERPTYHIVWVNRWGPLPDTPNCVAP